MHKSAGVSLAGSPGDAKPVGHEVFEFYVDHGPSYHPHYSSAEARSF